MRAWKLAILAAVLAAALGGGCWGGGYYHTHPHICPDGAARTHRHWHADTGFAGHHREPLPNDQHKGTSWDNDSLIPGK